MAIRPLHDRIVVRRSEEEQKTAGVLRERRRRRPPHKEDRFLIFMQSRLGTYVLKTNTGDRTYAILLLFAKQRRFLW